MIIKIVIDIPNYIYKTLIETGKYGFYRFDAKRAIKNGISFDNILDKIEAEIEIITNGISFIDKNKVFEIIDKYRNEVSE